MTKAEVKACETHLNELQHQWEWEVERYKLAYLHRESKETMEEIKRFRDYRQQQISTVKELLNEIGYYTVFEMNKWKVYKH